MLSDNQLLHYGAKILVFILFCGFVVGQVNTQYRDYHKDDIVYPGSSASRSRDRNLRQRTTSYMNDSETLIPLSLAAKLNSIESADEYLQLLGEQAIDLKYTLNSRFGERSNAERPRPAKCMPELQTVSLKVDNDPSTIILPSCTRVKRCGGCCSTSLLSCQPTVTEMRNFEVFVTSINKAGSGLKFNSFQIVPVEEHTKCKCDCKIKEEHCNEKQDYDPEECVCKCNNVDEAEKCRKNEDIKIWDRELCVCVCRVIEECGTGFYFDRNTCRCQEMPLFRQMKDKFGSTRDSIHGYADNRKPEHLVPPVIISLDASDPKRKHKEDPEYK